jgi:hypothetical protein
MGWARSISLISYNTGTFYSNFGKFQWCFTSPGYVTGLRQYKDGKVKPFFLIADVLIGGEAQEKHVNFFVEKLKILNAQKNISRFMPFLIVESVTENAFKLLKENGVIVGFVNKLFGREYADLLGALTNTIVNAGAILKKDPEQYLNLLTRIDKLVEGKTNNLRGDLFELAVGYFHSRSVSFDIGKRINYDGKLMEIDVFSVYHDSIYFAECKGYKKEIGIGEVEDWLEKIAIVRKWMLNIDPFKDKKMIAEFWSTGGFTEDALAKLKALSGNTRKYKICYYDGAGIKKKFQELGSKKIIDTLNQYFFKEQL